MTLYTCLSLSENLGIDLETPVKVEPSVEDVIGTTANLRAGDTLTLSELMYGLMLPSGNDAGYMLALYYGRQVLSLQ
jgi:serine-type D-Ala-D-Ala carboxypeptidase (penicillin-binding protein 5/6)